MHLLAVFSLRNRALIALVTVVVGFFGVIALNGLKQELIPSVSFPQVVIVTAYPGAAPEVVNTDVSLPIETALQGISGLESTTATSSTNMSLVNASFEYGTDLVAAEQKVQLAINRIGGTLPEDVDPRVITGTIDDLPVIQLAVTSGLDQRELADLLRASTLTDIEQLDGVREASLLGDPGQRITITPDAAQIAARGLAPTAIRDALDENGTLLPAGSIVEGDRSLAVQAGTRVTSLEELRALPVLGGSSPATLGEVASVELTENPTTGLSRVNGEPALTIAVTKMPDGNTVDVSHAVRDALPELAAALGEGTQFTVVFDQAPYIEQSIEALSTEGLLGLAFAVIVILVFLLSIRSTLVTAISIPASVLITFIALWASEYTLNILTLGGLTIAIGRVVDDSIVVIENIKRHLGLGQDRMLAITTAVREVAAAITASTVTTVAVFLPLALVGDITGELFRPFALTVTIALAASLFVSLTIVPVLAYWFLGRKADSLAREQLAAGEPHAHAEAEEPQAAVHAGQEADAAAPASATTASSPTLSRRERRSPVVSHEDELDRPTLLQRGYLPVIHWTLKRPAITLLLAAAVLGGTVALVPSMKTNFIGDSGQNTLTVTQQLGLGASLDAKDEAASQVESALLDIDGIETVQTSIGSEGNSLRAAFGGSADITYSITTDATADQPELQQRVRDRLTSLKGVGTVQLAAAGSGFASSDIEVNISAASPEALKTAADRVLKTVRALDVTAEASSNLSQTQPYIAVKVDRTAAAERGLSELAVDGLVAQAMQPLPIGSLSLNGTVLTVYQDTGSTPASIDELRTLPVFTSAGPVPLSALASVEEADGPASITAIRGVRSATVSVTPNSDDVGTASATIDEAVSGLDLPAGVTVKLGGVTAQQADAFQQLGIALLVAILIVYVVMVATFRSLRQPLLLLISVPFAATGAILLQVATGVPLGVPSLVGVLMLIGIVVTNAIVLVDLVNQFRDRGYTVPDAIVHGAARRLRPILMTALATIFALVPMALGITGHGGFISQPLAIVVIGGLISSTLLTLVVLPALYSLVEGASERRAARRRGEMERRDSIDRHAVQEMER
ncbi:efflux RND transporter permease subunit [Ruicaihuangia caeni]|uniref:Efflux RND transporter permease subunit n=1 Tax=Ruicaihuangia caeni TaxID=3042517 RepID=A0AAW6T4N2_9MICO|nr:efflux RND transporter permease subunit [Klugiella sp. YN-L-19]MDI2098414.1 efflux RND transporter permease subunit [Klugiella sp. YN-L-19]